MRNKEVFPSLIYAWDVQIKTFFTLSFLISNSKLSSNEIVTVTKYFIHKAYATYWNDKVERKLQIHKFNIKKA